MILLGVEGLNNSILDVFRDVRLWNAACGVTPPPLVLSKCRFEECVCVMLTELCEMQVRALCFEEIVCVPGSLRALGWFVAVPGVLHS